MRHRWPDESPWFRFWAFTIIVLALIAALGFAGAVINLALYIIR